MKCTDLADKIFRELGEPDDTNIPFISFWLQVNIGQLNVLLETGFIYDEVLQEFSPELDEGAANIFGLLYTIHYYNNLIRLNLGAGAYDWSELVEGDTNIRRVSRNEISKSYIQVKNALETRLNQMVFMYRKGKALPLSLSAIIPFHLRRFYRV